MPWRTQATKVLLPWPGKSRLASYRAFLVRVNIGAVIITYTILGVDLNAVW